MSYIGKSVRYGSMVSAAVLCCASSFVMREEGLRTSAYLDSVGVPTICYGETENVKLGDKKSPEECSELFSAKLGFYAYSVQTMIDRPLPPETLAAFTSWAYNVGLNAARKSTLIKKARTGDITGACAELPRWKYAGGKAILLNRREREKELCLKGLQNV